MALNRFMVDDLGKFGRLIKDWAKDKEPIPRSKDEFAAALTKAGIVPSWPTGDHEIVSVIVEKVPLGVLHLLVAPKELIAESEQFLSQPGVTYPLADYYEMDAFHTPPNVANNVDFNDKRTGDYTVSHCT